MTTKTITKTKAKTKAAKTTPKAEAKTKTKPDPKTPRESPIERDRRLAKHHAAVLDGNAYTCGVGPKLRDAVEDLAHEEETLNLDGSAAAFPEWASGLQNARKMTVLAMRLLINAFELES